MILLHIIDDFVMQPISLSKLKQKEYWIEECKKYQVDFNDYKHDYLIALFLHSASWTIMIHLPFLFLNNVNETIFGLSLLINTIIHMIIDNLKANYKLINLCQDQFIHLLQILITFLIIT